MPVDTSIYGNIRPAAPLDPFKAQEQILTLGALRDQAALRDIQRQLTTEQLESARRNEQRDTTLADLYRSMLRPDGTVDQAGLLRGAAERGIGQVIPDQMKKFADLDYTRAQAASQEAQRKKADLDLNLRKIEARAGVLATLVNDPELSHQTVISALTDMVNNGLISSGEGFQAVRQLPGNPAKLRQFLLNQQVQVMSAADRMKALLPEFEMKDTGKQLVPFDKNPFTNPNPVALTKTTTPGEDLNSRTSMRNADVAATTARRGQDITDNRERTLAGLSVSYEKDAQGNFVALPSKPMPGDMVRARPVAAPGGMTPLQGSLPESQGKALMDINRMRAIVSGGLQAVVDTPSAFSFGRGAATSVPFGESIASRTDSEKEMQVRSYVFNIVSGVINERAGAAQSAQELQRLRAFLPAETDNAKQIENKLRGFETYLQDLEQGTRMPRNGSAPAAPAASPRPAANPFVGAGLPPDIANIFQQAGVK